jgi:predicted  nucleic acid-binding Zn-ribbon protein
MMARRGSLLTLIVLPLSMLCSTTAQADETEEYRYVVASYQNRLHALDSQQAQCLSSLNSALQQQVDVLDRTQLRVWNRPRGEVTIKESLALDQTQGAVDGAKYFGVACDRRIRAERTDIQTALGDPERLRTEAARVRVERQRLSAELRRQLDGLLETARGAYEIIATVSSYDAFALRLTEIRQQIQSINAKHALSFQMGDHRVLVTSVSEACNALYAVEPDWKKEREAANNLATAQATADRYRSIRYPSAMDRANGDESTQRLRDAQQEYEQAKAQLAAKRDSVARLMSEAVRVARAEREPTQQVSVEARNP